MERIWVKEGTYKDIKRLKKSRRVKKFDDVIRILLKRSEMWMWKR